MVLIIQRVPFIGGARNLKGAIGDELGAGVEGEGVGAHGRELLDGRAAALVQP